MGTKLRLIGRIHKVCSADAYVSDDEIVTTMIRYVAYDLQKRYENPYARKAGPISLERWNNQIVQNLIQYCNYMIGEKKPEWQILAERHGWMPPNKL